MICDDEKGGYLATKALIDNGHKRILILQGEPYISSSRERLAGYIRAHEEAGLKVNEELIQEGSVISGNNHEQYQRILDQNLGFTGIFAFSDLIAWDFWRFLHMKGYHVPRDFSLIGFDHIQSRLSVPIELSSIVSHKGLMSEETVDVLVSIIRGEAPTDHHIQRIVDTALSTGETIRSLL